jgi:hypothetical protein
MNRREYRILLANRRYGRGKYACNRGASVRELRFSPALGAKQFVGWGSGALGFAFRGEVPAGPVAVLVFTKPNEAHRAEAEF